MENPNKKPSNNSESPPPKKTNKQLLSKTRSCSSEEVPQFEWASSLGETKQSFFVDKCIYIYMYQRSVFGKMKIDLCMSCGFDSGIE